MAKVIDEKVRRMILTGNIWKVVIYITFPLFMYQLMNSFYNLIDQIMVAQIGDTSVSAVATISQIKGLLSSLGAGLAGGGAIIVSRLYGAGNIKEAKKNANVLFTLGLIVNAIILFIFLPFSTQILMLAQVPDELLKISQGYFALQLIEQIIIVINTIFIGLEKSKGNTKIIFIGNILIMAIKLSLNSLFIYGFHVTNLIWIEVASLISQGSMMVIALYFLFRKSNIFRIEFKELSLQSKYVKRIIWIALPLFLGKFVIYLGKVSVNAMCKAYGALTVGALGISNNICGMITNPGNAFEDSESSIVSQNLGNRNMKRTLKTFFASCALMFTWSFIGFLLVRVIFQDQIISLFSTKNTSEEFVSMIKSIFYYDCLSIPALAINAVILGLLYGYGQTILSTINNLLRISTRIGVLWYLQTYHQELGAEAAGISMGISNIAIAIFSIIILILFLIKTNKKGYKGMHFNDKEVEMMEVNGILVRKDIKEKKYNLNEKNPLCKGYLQTFIRTDDAPLVLVIPGGGYDHLSTRESRPVSDKFLSLGYNSAILYYSTKGEHYPVQQEEINTAIEIIKSFSSSLILCGFSAGGHLALLGGTDEYGKYVDALVLCYPVITLGAYTHEGTKKNIIGDLDEKEMSEKLSGEKRVNKKTPPTFIWTSEDDESVPYQNTLLMIEALKNNDVYHEYKIYKHARHGSALGDETAIKDGDTSFVNKEIQEWPLLADRFIKKVVANKKI